MVDIVWREDQAGWATLANMVRERGPLRDPVHFGEDDADGVYCGIGGWERGGVFLCTVEGTLTPEEKEAILRLARLRYAEFFEEEKCT